MAKAMELADLVYRASQDFPNYERYGLTTQLRRSAVSIPSNIAEGSARRTSGEFLQSLGYALGSLAELETQIILAQRFGYLNVVLGDPLLALADEVGRIVRGLAQALEASRIKEPTNPYSVDTSH